MTHRPKSWFYDAHVGVRVANVVALVLLTCLCPIPARAQQSDDPSLAVIGGGVQRSEDGPFVPTDYEFLPGDYLHFTFQISGFKTKANSAEMNSLSLQYRITPQDLNGVPLAAAVEETISADLGKEDKNWTPKRRASFLLPSFVASGEYRVQVTVKDAIAKTEATRNYPFRIGGTSIQPSTSIRAGSFEFLRNSEDPKAVEVPAYRPGDTVYARFIMSGFKMDAGNKYRLSYGIKVLRPDGKSFLDEPKAAQIAADSFYPAQFVPGELEITTPANAVHGSYQLMLTVQDLIANQSFEIRQAFTIE